VRVPRYTDLPLPPYRHAPGQTPHPTRDPRGHSFGAAPLPAELAFRYGCDLFNRGFLWEAHEAWEGPWRALPRGGERACLLRGLIQAAAALLKERLGAGDACRRLAARADANLALGSAAGPLAGLDVGAFRRALGRRATELHAPFPILSLRG
jgi:hypothetical protein